MDAVALKQALERGRELERQGQADLAIKEYMKAGASEDAARLLIAARRYAEAAPILYGSLGISDPARIPGLEANKKRRALMAAICFANASDVQRAVDIFLKLGERQRAIDVLQKAGDFIGASRLEQASDAELPNLAYAAPVRQDKAASSIAAAQKLERDGKLDMAMQAYLDLKQFGHAARMAHLLRKPAQAAELFSEGGMPYEAAVCYLEAGDTGKCLECLVRVPREDKRYRQACVHAVKLANDLNLLDFQLEHFLSKFSTTGPLDDREFESFYILAKLYRKHDFLENAKDCYHKILTRNPGYRDVSQKLQEIEAETRGSPMVYEKILKEEEAFRSGVDKHRRATGANPKLNLPDDDLPDLPSLPPVAVPPVGSGAVRAAAPRSAAAPAAVARETSRRTAGGRPATMADPPPKAPMYPAPLGTAYESGSTPTVGSGPNASSRRGAAAEIRSDSSPSGDASPYLPSAFEPSGPKVSPPGHGSGLAEGAMVGERYRLEKKIGQGGMAVVFRAHDLELGEDIAIKFFSHMVADEQMLARFKQELSLSRQLNHPNVIRLYDIGTYLDYKFITMELLDGSDLTRHLGGKPIDFTAGIALLVQACNALEAVHGRGVIHRDIKPDNFFITSEGTLKVMDFGIAKKQGKPGMTVAGMIAGTPEYMSPEQINDLSSVTKATDLYALGIMAYQMFTGSLPFTHAELMPLLVMHVTDKPEPPRKRNPNIPPELEAVILKLLEKNPADRIGSCADLARALNEVRKALR